MSPVYRSTLVSLASLAAVAAIAWAAAGAALGLSVFAAGLLALLVYHVRHLARFGRWVSHPVQGKAPEGAGSWDGVLAALHRFEREAAKREEMLADALARLRSAAQALPDGVVILDANHRIEWCNDNAAAMLGLDARADIGRPIANLLREPAFVDYLASPDHAATPAFRAPIWGFPGPSRGGSRSTTWPSRDSCLPCSCCGPSSARHSARRWSGSARASRACARSATTCGCTSTSGS